MEDYSIHQLLNTVEIISAVKPLFTSQNPYLPVYSALGGAFVGAIASIIPSLFLEKFRQKRDAKALTLQIYSEIKSYIQFLEYRGYIEHLSMITKQIEEIGGGDTFVIHFPDKRHAVFEAALPKLGTVEIPLQVRFISFYQLVESFIQDVKPGGNMNSQQCGIEDFSSLLSLGYRVIDEGKSIMSTIETLYDIKPPEAS